MAKVTYESPLKHLLMSFTDEQRMLWDLYRKGKKLRCVTVDKLLTTKKLTSMSVALFRETNQKLQELNR